MKRFTQFRIALCAVTICINLIAQASTQPQTLTHSSKWYVNYGDDSCRLAREFGTEDSKVTMILERFGPGDAFTLALVGKAMRGGNDADPARIQFGPVQGVQKVEYYTGDFGKGKPALIFRGSIRIAAPSPDEIKRLKSPRPSAPFDYEPIRPEQEAAVTFIRVDGPLSQPVILETKSLGKPFEAMRQCTDDLMTTWGVDPGKYAKQSKAVAPVGSIARWLTDADYPGGAIAAGRRGIVHFRLSIDETGKATACYIQQSTSAKDFDDTVCNAIMRRAKFQPALDEGGKPMTSFYRNTVIFDIPTRPTS